MNIKNGALAPTGSACLEKVLGRLDKVKSTGRSKWVACCPAHDDQDPSLSITEASDGKVLLKCWAGCSAAEIVGAVGLEMRDLFPDGDRLPRRTGPSRQAIEFEQRILEAAAVQARQGKPFSEKDQIRIRQAVEFLEAAR